MKNVLLFIGFGLLILIGAFWIAGGIAFYIEQFTHVTATTKNEIKPKVVISIDNGVSDTTYVYKFKR